MSLPVGTLVLLNPHTRVHEDGRILVGGSPTRLWRLGEPARDLLRHGHLRVAPGPAAVLADRLVDLGLVDPDPDSLPALPLVDVTVVIPVHDRAEALDRLLAALPPVREVIVVDDASTDPATIAEVCRRRGVVLARLDRNGGPAAARNAGLRLVHTPFVAFLDSDVVPDPGSLERLARHLHDPDVALVAPRIRGLESGGGWVTRYESARSSLDLGAHPAVVRPRSQVAWLPSACMVGRVSALGTGFTDGMRVGEDVDLTWRLVAAGRRVRYEPTAVVRHEHRTTLRPWLLRKAFYGTSAHDLAQRHGSAVAPAVLAPWSVVFVAALLSQRRWSLPAAATAYAVATARLVARVPGADRPLSLAARLSAAGAVVSVTQASALVLRHGWPLALTAGLQSTRVRRAAAVCAVVDGVVEWRRTRADLDPLRFLVARRLDDLAYGAGVWFAALRGRSVRALLPAIATKDR